MESTQQAGWISKIKIWIMEYKRVLTVTKKPTKEEFLTVVKISALGILVIGLIGFVIQMMKILLFQ
ncbi:protein translocase SEC61 complex subunit gamma [Candidatus Woesearchaeota archaeon]|nr:protein translocase SEC61 complex subunit gamma [Candidatus Woesearchaeota archaeon]